MSAMEKLELPNDRNERLSYLRRNFPDAKGPDATMVGGRKAALAALATVDPVAYNRTRNFLDGKVTRLSPYFRHGMITLKEAADVAIKKSKSGAYKFVFELAWRDFWRRVWWERGDDVREDIEEAKVPIGSTPLPKDIREGRTGLPCMDAFVDELTQTGYVHNHARMWFAAYVVHHRKVDWREAADWYYRELLDGDWASNHLSWQWIASTFSHKPYFFNKENLQRYTNDQYCADCKARCPFDASYEVLEQRLFGRSVSR
jgi:deoxyribodipyrimidine photo-lyase